MKMNSSLQFNGTMIQNFLFKSQQADLMHLQLSAVSFYSGYMLPPICLEYEFHEDSQFVHVAPLSLASSPTFTSSLASLSWSCLIQGHQTLYSQCINPKCFTAHRAKQHNTSQHKRRRQTQERTRRGHKSDDEIMIIKWKKIMAPIII